jgi:ABC-type Fe3+-hydroxamate transport system substrate-binding protein
LSKLKLENPLTRGLRCAADGSTARVDALKPDLVITFSDVQAEAARELIRRGHAVLATNQRAIAEILETILLIGGALTHHNIDNVRV